MEEVDIFSLRIWVDQDTEARKLGADSGNHKVSILSKGWGSVPHTVPWTIGPTEDSAIKGHTLHTFNPFLGSHKANEYG